MPIAFLAEVWRNLAIGLLENIADILKAFSVVILNSIQIVRMNKFDQKVGQVIDGIFVSELKFSQTPLGQFMKNQADRVIFWNRVPQDTNHWNTPLPYRRLIR